MHDKVEPVDHCVASIRLHEIILEFHQSGGSRGEVGEVGGREEGEAV